MDYKSPTLIWTHAARTSGQRIFQYKATSLWNEFSLRPNLAHPWRISSAYSCRWKLLKGEGHSKNRVFFFPSPIKSSHWVEFLTVVSASEVDAIPMKKRWKVRHWEPPCWKDLEGQAAYPWRHSVRECVSSFELKYGCSWSQNVLVIPREIIIKLNWMIGWKMLCGVLVRDVQPYPRKQNVFVAENSRSSSPRWKVHFAVQLQWTQLVEDVYF